MARADPSLPPVRPYNGGFFGGTPGQIDAAAGQMGVKARVHLKSTRAWSVSEFIYSAGRLQEAALKFRHVEVEGIFSHFANADSRICAMRVCSWSASTKWRDSMNNAACRCRCPYGQFSRNSAASGKPSRHGEPRHHALRHLPFAECFRIRWRLRRLLPGSRACLFQGGEARSWRQLRIHLAVRPRGAHCHGPCRLWRWLFRSMSIGHR